MNILGGNFLQLSNIIFCYGLTPIQLAVYAYLVSCAGQKGKCWPAMKTIASCCNCSANTVRNAVTELERHGFIRKVATYFEDTNRQNRQTNNTYYILELPDVPPRPKPVYREVDGGCPA